MFNVTADYIAAAHSPSRETDMRGQIILNTGRVVPFTSINLLQGSTSYSNKCLNANTFTLGSCYIGEFKTTIKTDIDRYALFGGRIIVEFLMKVAEDQWEVVNIGTFTITSANRVGNYVEIDSFDNMSLLENSMTTATSGTAENLFNWICKECNVESGMTPSMWSQLTNTEFVFAVSNKNYGTYRDLLSDIATVTGGFATVDRFGGLVILPFGQSPVDVIDDNIRTSSKFEDYKCTYTSISMKVNDDTYTSSADIDDGMNIAFENNYLIAANSDEDIKTIIDNLLAKLLQINYVPCKVDMVVNPAYDLGDIVSFVGYNTGNETINSYIHSINWTFRSSMNIECIGENAKIAKAKSIADKNADAANSYAEMVELKTVVYENAEAIDIGPSRSLLLDLSFSTIKNELAVPMLTGQFVADIEDAGLFRITYELNGRELEFKPEDAIYHTGRKTFTFIKSLEDTDYISTNKIRVFIETSPLMVTNKVLTKNEETNEYTLTDVEERHEGAGTIAIGDLTAQLQSTNLEFAEEWDGKFEIVEELPRLVKGLHIVDSTDELDMSVIEYIKSQLNGELSLHNNSHVSEVTSNVDYIMDYDVVPYHEMLFEELENDSYDTGNLEADGVISWSPSGQYATSIKGYYMQLPSGQSTRISAVSSSQIQIYLMTSIATETYKIEKVGENNIIKYTSNGDRFWVIIAGANRQNNGNYTITATQIDDVNAIYIKVRNGFINGNTTMTEGSFRKGDTITFTANLPQQGQFFKSWQTSNHDVSRQSTFSMRLSFDGEYTATYSDVETAPAPTAFIGEFKRTNVASNFTCNLETDGTGYTVQKIAFVYTKDRSYIERLDFNNTQDGHVFLAHEITSEFPTGAYSYSVPIDDVLDDIYTRVEIQYTLDGLTTQSIFSNVVETHYLDSVDIEEYSASFANPDDFECNTELVDITTDGFKQKEKIETDFVDLPVECDGCFKSATIAGTEWYIQDESGKYHIENLEINI